MARKVKDSGIDTREARLKKRPHGKPYWTRLASNLHLGYRRLKGQQDGTWTARRYVEGGKYETKAIGDADDYNDANGQTILTYDQAQDETRAWLKARTAAGIAAPLTVRQAVESHIAKRDARETRRKGRKFRSDAHRLERYVIGREQRDKRSKRKAIPPAKLADVTLQTLTEEDLSKWRAGLPGVDSSKQRTVNDLKSALNDAFEANRNRLSPLLPAIIKHGLKKPDDYDDEVAEPLARDNQILTDAQVSQLLRAAREVDAEQGWDGDLFRMAVVLAATGARFSQIARMHVTDCQYSNKRLMVPKSRKGKGKSGSTAVQIGKDVLDALRSAVLGRPGDALLLERWRYKQVKRHKRAVLGNTWERDDRSAWRAASEFDRPWNAIRERAKMPDVIPYALRHSSIVRGIRANLPIRLVAAMHDTSVAMIEQHYAKWIVDGLEELAARAVVPLVPAEKPGKVTPLQARA
jgi:integrase